MTFTCGSELDLSNILLVWTAANGACPITPANNPNGKYCFDNPVIDITPPLNAVAEAECGIGNTTNIDLTVEGGVGPFTYLWSNGETTEDLTNVPLGTYTVTVTDNGRKDANGHQCTVVASTTFEGPCCEPPVITCPTDLTQDCTESTHPDNTGTATSEKGCGEVDISFEDNSVPGACANEETILRTWIATDENGSADSCVQTITVTDNIAPVPPAPPADLTLQCADDVPPPIALTATDNCGGEITENPFLDVTRGLCPNELILVRTWTFTDFCGNTSSVSQTITVLDTLPPVAPAPPADLTLDCDLKVPPPSPLSALDNCDGPITADPTTQFIQGSCLNDYTLIRTWTFTDVCGNSSSVSQTITVLDTLAPVPDPAPANLSLECLTDVPPPLILTAIDNCDGLISAAPHEEEFLGGCINDFTLIRTWTFTDVCGNTSSVSQTITVLDTIAPAAPAAPADLNLECASDVPDAIDLTATDNCDADITVAPSEVELPGGCVNDFTLIRTWTFTDDCGNTSSVSQTITVLDDTAPAVPPAPADLNLACASDVPDAIDLTATDNCDADITVAPDEEVIPGGCVNDFTLIRTWTFTDVCGNTSSVSQTITVLDTIAPAAPAAPADLTLQCANDVPAPINLTAIDNCDGDITVSPTTQITPGACLNDFTMVRTWTFVDTCGNASSVSQTITVQDDTAPTAPPAPADLSLECADDVPPPINLTAVDNCDGEITVSPSTQITPGACLNDFTLVRTWTFVDTCGNTSSVSQTITVLDTLAPVAPAAPADLSLECADDVPPPINLTAVDNCDGEITVSPSTQITPGACLNDFVMVRTWTFTDTCGNTSSVSQTITVLDTLAPVPQSAPADLNLACASDVPPPVNLTAIDNCSGELTVGPSTVIVPGACLNDFTMVRTWTFSDTCGNTSSVSQTITVLDTLAPVPQSAPADLNLACASDVPPPVNLTAIDNCSGELTVGPSTVIVPGACINDFTMVRTWTFSDTCGNTSSVSQTISVLDTLAPVPQAAPADLNLACASDVPPPVNLTAIDNCSGELTVGPSTVIVPGACINDFTMVRTWTFTDTCGNTSSVSQTIKVLDDLAPDLIAPADIPALSCTESTDPSNTGVATATDNCDGELVPTYTDVIIAGAGVDCYTIKRTWSATDTCGNTASQLQTMNVVDDVPPTFVDCPADVVLACTEDVPAVASPQAVDNCDNEVDVVYNGEVRDDSCGEDFYTLTRTWTATDNCGNTTTCEQVITVNTRLTNPCYSLELELVYDQAANTTRFTWELCLIGDKCKDISNIRFSIPCDLPKSYLLETYSSVSGLKAEINNKTGRCNGRYDVQFDGFRDGALKREPGRCATFSYLLRGDLREWETDVSIKAGNQQGLNFDDVGQACSCIDANGAAAPHELSNNRLLLDGAVSEGIADVQLFPNPVEDVVTLRFDNPTGEPVMIHIYDATGRLQFARQLITSEGFNQVDVEVTSLPTGLYRMVLTPNSGPAHTRPFIRLHR
ncbi:T9SS type A sorting domain-containing protein [Neolewinella litorea]|uniref:T9SS type A sorting domain-containing protein n=1 Tax=Neolewinella litorea TaxID=2562452 RepID=UPI00145605C0|nr:T9SS type A sorting domain-containing protein [Neolewinella litorea]